MTVQPTADIDGRDQIIKELTAPGASFEVVQVDIRGQSFPVYRNAPPTLVDLFRIGRNHGDTVFLVENDQRLTYADVFRQADGLSAWLAGPGGVKKGDRVAIAMRNRSEWLISFIAIVQIGAIAVLINSRGAGVDMKAALEDLDPALTIADDRRAAALKEAGWTGRVLHEGDEWQAALKGGQGWNPASVEISPDDPSCVLFTSGTTGRAKGAVLSHRGIITGMMNGQFGGALLMSRMARQYGVPLEAITANVPKPVNMLVFPLFHVSGLSSMFLTSLLLGGKIIIVQRWDPAEALQIVGREKVTSLSGVPTMLWDVLHRAKLGDADLSSLGTISIGGQATPMNLLEEVRQNFPTAILGTGYGMTETCGGISLAMGDDYLCRPQSSGFVLPTTQMRILDDQGNDLPPGQTGEIAVRGVAVMLGYWNRPEDTAAALNDGWLKTGDVGYVDADGYVFVVDRKKDMIISGGENIYCAEVERVISHMPDVLEVITFGLPDERMGEKLVAVITVRPGSTLDADMVRAHVTEELAAYKAPVDVHIGTELMPRNATGKIEKRHIRAQWLAKAAA